MDPSQPFSNMDISHEKFLEAVGWSPYAGQSSQAAQPGAKQMPIQVDEPRSTTNAGTRGTRGRKKNVPTRVKGSNFSPKEDVLVWKAWIQVSNDAVVNTGQKKDRFWDRILSVYNEHRGTLPERSFRSLQSRWETIKEQVGKFIGFHDEALRENRSGYTDADKVTHAAAAFAEIEEQPFQLMHCWELMKDEPKWMDTKHNKGHKISTTTDMFEDNIPDYSQSVDKSTENTPNDSTASGSRAKRPLGRDATKAANKRANSSSSSAADYVTNMQVLNLEKLTALKEEYGRRHVRDEEQMAIEKEKVTIDREKVSIEKEKVELQRSQLDRQLTLEERRFELQRQAEERERELALLRLRAEDERILSIDLDNCANDGLRAYYQSLKEAILARVRGGN